jgi:hypothetical protein
MLIVIRGDGRASLEDVDNFRAFSVKAGCAAAMLPEAIAVVGRLDDQGYAWIPRSWLLENGRAGDADWLGQFEKMAAYASSAGWLDAGGAIRAHVEMNEGA